MVGKGIMLNKVRSIAEGVLLRILKRIQKRPYITAGEFVKVVRTMPNNRFTFELDRGVAGRLIGRKIMESLGDGPRANNTQTFAVGVIYGVGLSFKDDMKYADTEHLWNVTVILHTSVGRYHVDCTWSDEKLGAKGNRIFSMPGTKLTSPHMYAKRREGAHVALNICAT